MARSTWRGAMRQEASARKRSKSPMPNVSSKSTSEPVVVGGLAVDAHAHVGGHEEPADIDDEAGLERIAIVGMRHAERAQASKAAASRRMVLSPMAQ